MIELTPTGIEMDSLAENLDAVKAEFRAAISPTLDLEETSLLGQYLMVIMDQIQQIKELAQIEYSYQDPDQASGDALVRLTRLVGVERLPATQSRALVTATLAAGNYPAASLVVHVQADPTARFYNRDAIAAVGGVSSNLVFLSEEAGPVRAQAGTLTVIANPVSGFANPTNPLDAELGFVQESDEALRARWRDQLARKGTGTVDAIRADVLAVPDVPFARVYENVEDFTVNGIPPHSFETLVLGGDDAAIAQAIFNSKPAGIQAYGQTVRSVTDESGSSHNIGFTRPTIVPIYLDITLTYQSGQLTGVDALKIVLTDWGDTHLGPGNDVIHNRIVQVLMSEPGIVDVVVKIGNAPNPTAEANYVIGVREIADIDSGPGRINITPLAITGAP